MEVLFMLVVPYWTTVTFGLIGSVKVMAAAWYDPVTDGLCEGNVELAGAATVTIVVVSTIKTDGSVDDFSGILAASPLKITPPNPRFTIPRHG